MNFYYFIAILLFIVITFSIQYNKRYEGFAESYLNGIDVIYWINLDRSPDRKKSMEEMFQDDAFQGIPNVRISAVDGKNPDNLQKLLTTRNTKQTDSEYGCLLSHLESIRTFNNSKYDIALIMEDDTTLEFKKYWTKTVRQIIENAPPDWEVINLCYIITTEHPYYDWNLIKNEYNDVPTWSTLAYLINKKGSKKLIHSTYDTKYNLKTYIYKYPMFIYKTENESTIHDSHLDSHKINKEHIIQQYESLK